VEAPARDFKASEAASSMTRQYALFLLLGLIVAACASTPPPSTTPLSARGQPVIVTTASHISGHKLVTIGEMREFNKNCGASRIAKGALAEFPGADAVTDYREDRGRCSVEITAGGELQFCGFMCQAKVVRFADLDISQ
jgi:hypothetical protein